MRRAQSRAKSGVPAGSVGEETTGANLDRATSGKVQAVAAGVKVSDGSCCDEETGAAGTGRDSDGGVAAQQPARVQGQQAGAEAAAPAAGACAGTNSVQTSNRLQTMASAFFIM